MCVEDGASLAECLDRAKTVDSIPRVLKAFENLRRARAESMIQLSRATMSQWHLPDGEQQVQRDAFWSSMASLIAAGSNFWDKKPVDDPPTGFMDPLLQPYFRGHNTVDFVSQCQRVQNFVLLTFVPDEPKIR
jgi:salicylate hydroxylase